MQVPIFYHQRWSHVGDFDDRLAGRNRPSSIRNWTNQVSHRGSSALDHIKILSGELQKPVLPDDFEDLSPEKKAKACKVFRQIYPVHALIKTVHQLRSALYIVLRLLQMEVTALLFSNNVWWKLLLPMGITFRSIKTVQPVRFYFPRRNWGDTKRSLRVLSIWRNFGTRTYRLGTRRNMGILLVETDPSAWRISTRRRRKQKGYWCLFLKGKDEEQEKIRRYWPMGKGKFVLTMESYV